MCYWGYSSGFTSKPTSTAMGELPPAGQSELTMNQSAEEFANTLGYKSHGFKEALDKVADRSFTLDLKEQCGLQKPKSKKTENKVNVVLSP